MNVLLKKINDMGIPIPITSSEHVSKERGPSSRLVKHRQARKKKNNAAKCARRLNKIRRR